MPRGRRTDPDRSPRRSRPRPADRAPPRGRRPRSRDRPRSASDPAQNAIRRPRRIPDEAAGTKSRASPGTANGDSGLGPAIAVSMSATSPTVRAIGPATIRVCHGTADGSRWHEPDARPHADHAAERGRRAQAAAEVGAVGQGDHPARERRRAAAGGAACRQREIPRVARRAEDGVDGVGAGRELGCVRLADHDGAGGLETRDDERVLAGIWSA